MLPTYSIRRSTRARRSRLTVNDQGEAVVVLPWRSSEREAADLVARHRRWIANHQRRIKSQLFELETRPQLGNGREIPFLGEPHRVVSIAAIDGRRRMSINVVDERIVLTTSPLEERSTAAILEGWFRTQARQAIAERIRLRGAEMGLSPRQVTIRDQKTRWGSASRRGTLSFSWRLIMCPSWVLDYVVVHELAHLKVSGHPRTFWRLVDRHFQDITAARRWLREHHDEIRHALD